MLISVALPLILAFIMFSLGLGLGGRDFSRVATYPRAFLTGLAIQTVLLPLLAFALVKSFALEGEIAVGVMILALCPGGAITNYLTRIALGNVPLSISLTAVTSLLSVVTMPILVALAVGHFLGSAGARVDVTRLGLAMFLLTAVPVAMGIGLTKLAPGYVGKWAGVISKTSLGLFALIVLLALVRNWNVFWTNLPDLGPALISLNVLLLALGLAISRLVGLGYQDTSTVSIESGVQNAALGIAVGSLIATGASEALPPSTVPSAVYGIVMYGVSLPFVLWRRRVNDGGP